MNILPRDKQIEIIAALTEGMSIRATERLTGVHRDTIMRLAKRVGDGCARLHNKTVHSVRVGRIEIDELWAYVGKKQKRVERHELAHKGDQYTFIALASSSKAILSYLTGKRDGANTETFIHDLRERVLGQPEISSDGWRHYSLAIRDAFGKNAAYGQIIKTYSVTHLAKEAAVRYSPAAVVAVSRDVVSGVPAQISTSYVERQHLTMRMSSKRFARLGNGFSKKLANHQAAVSLYVWHFNFCRVHEATRTSPAVALGIADHVWSIGELVDAALAIEPGEPADKGPDRRRTFRVIEGGRT